ncbi:DUF305 domain-containing protein [Streptomyces sp. NPDC059922]|uniref:DUF305 domain-containing protein n=1 Tax=Streptomyces sp. NPDC059922 TaxID=3347005 RepID=UPI003653D4DE
MILCVASGVLLVALPGRTQATQARPGSYSADAGFSRDMTTMTTREQLGRLRAAKKREAEVLYLQLMIPHHQGGVAMAKAAMKQARGRQVVALADGMARAQQTDIRLMRDILNQRGAPRPEAPAPALTHH